MTVLPHISLFRMPFFWINLHKKPIKNRSSFAKTLWISILADSEYYSTSPSASTQDGLALASTPRLSALALMRCRLPYGDSSASLYSFLSLSSALEMAKKPNAENYMTTKSKGGFETLNGPMSSFGNFYSTVISYISRGSLLITNLISWNFVSVSRWSANELKT
jgi:hypothetical protein